MCCQERNTHCTHLQVDFLFDVYEEITGGEPESFVELGCGPAQHSLEMAESGLEVIAVDDNQSMLSYAGDLAEQDSLKLTFLKQDMRQLELAVCCCLHSTVLPLSIQTRCKLHRHVPSPSDIIFFIQRLHSKHLHRVYAVASNLYMMLFCIPL